MSGPPFCHASHKLINAHRQTAPAWEQLCDQRNEIEIARCVMTGPNVLCNQSLDVQNNHYICPWSWIIIIYKLSFTIILPQPVCLFHSQMSPPTRCFLVVQFCCLPTEKEREKTQLCCFVQRNFGVDQSHFIHENGHFKIRRNVGWGHSRNLWWILSWKCSGSAASKKKPRSTENNYFTLQ